MLVPETVVTSAQDVESDILVSLLVYFLISQQPESMLVVTRRLEDSSFEWYRGGSPSSHVPVTLSHACKLLPPFGGILLSFQTSWRSYALKNCLPLMMPEVLASLQPPPPSKSNDPVGTRLYGRWVQHNSDRCAEGLGRKVVSELSANHAGVSCKLSAAACTFRVSEPLSRHTVWSGDLAPDHPDLGSPDLLRCAVNECDLLSEVEAMDCQRIDSILCISSPTYLAASVLSTPSILIKLVPGVVLRLPRW